MWGNLSQKINQNPIISKGSLGNTECDVDLPELPTGDLSSPKVGTKLKLNPRTEPELLTPVLDKGALRNKLLRCRLQPESM